MKKLTVKCPKCEGKGGVPYFENGRQHENFTLQCGLCKGEGKLVLEVLEDED